MAKNDWSITTRECSLQGIRMSTLTERPVNWFPRCVILHNASISHMQKSARNFFPVVWFLLKLIVGDYFEPPTDKPWMCDIWCCNCGFAEDSTCVECSALSVGKYIFINQNGITFQNIVSINHWVDVLAYRISIFRHFAKWWKVTVSFILFVCLSIPLPLFTWNNLAPTRCISMKFDMWVFFANLPRKFKIF